MQYKKLYRDEDVLTVATRIIKKYGQATVVEIRDVLREDSFWATKVIIRETMDSLVEAGHFQHDFNEPGAYFLPL